MSHDLMHPTSPASQPTSRFWAALVWPSAAGAAFNLAWLLQALHDVDLHPVRHTVAAPSGGWAWPGVWAWALAFAVSAAIVLAALLRCRTANADLPAPLARALLPGALALAYPVVGLVLPAVSVEGAPRLTFAALVGAIVLFGWTASRVWRVLLEVCPDSAIRWASWRGWCVLCTVATVGLMAFHTFVQMRLFDAWLLGSPDIGYYAEMLQSVLRGRGLYCEAFGHSFFAEHFSPGLYLLVPIYALWPHVETLMVVGAAAVLSGSWALWVWVRSRGGSPALAAAVSMAYLLHPSTSRVIYGGSYGFHEVLLAIPAMLWSFYFLQRSQWMRAAVLAAIAMSFKETVVVVYAAVGLCLALRGRRRVGLGMFGSCTALFAVIVVVIVPGFRGDGDYSKLYLYKELGEGAGGLLSTMVQRPGSVLVRIFSWQALGFAAGLLVPLALLPIRRLMLAAALPTFVFICLMDTASFASIRFWHQTTLLPVLWWAAVETLSGPQARRGRAAALLTCTLLMHYSLGLSPVSRLWRVMPLDATAQRESMQQLQALVPTDATVQCTARLAAHFVDRRRVYPVRRDPPTPVDWLILDLEDNFEGPQASARVREMLSAMRVSRSYIPVWNQGPVVALRRAAEP